MTVYQRRGAPSAIGTSVSDTAYDATSWNGVTDVAPSKNAVRDKFESLSVSAMQVIAQTIVGAGGVASVVFQSIPQTYEDLFLGVIARSTTTGDKNLLARVNGDTGANYDRQVFEANGTTLVGAAGLAQTSWRVGAIPASDKTAGSFAMAFMQVYGYTSTVFRKMMSVPANLLPNNDGSNGTLDVTGGLWRSTAAINRVELLPSAGSFAEGSRFTLYGLKGA